MRITTVSEMGYDDLNVTLDKNNHEIDELFNQYRAAYAAGNTDLVKKFMDKISALNGQNAFILKRIDGKV